MSATKILVTAISGKVTSKPFVLYTTTDEELPKQLVLRIEDDVNRNGDPTLKLSNGNLGAIVSHQPEYITNIITGFRVDIQDVTCVVVQRFVDDLPSLTTAKKGSAY
jgi:hypothetical protein